LAIVLVIALIVFGPKRLPELGRSLGKGIREFRGSLSGESHEPAQRESIEQPPLPAEKATEKAAEGEGVAHERH